MRNSIKQLIDDRPACAELVDIEGDIAGGDGSIGEGEVFAHPRDAIIAFTVVDGVDSLAIVFFRSNGVDQAHDGYAAYFSSDGTRNITVTRITNNAATSLLATADGAYADNDRVVIALRYDSIKLYVEGELLLDISSVAHINNVQGEVNFAGTGGTHTRISNLKVWNWTCHGEEGV